MEKLIWFGGVVKGEQIKGKGGKHVLPAVFSVHRKMLQVIIKYSENHPIILTSVSTHRIKTNSSGK